MDKNKLSVLSNEELLQQQKSLKTVIFMLAGTLIVLFILTLILALHEQLVALNAIPIVLILSKK